MTSRIPTLHSRTSSRFARPELSGRSTGPEPEHKWGDDDTLSRPPELRDPSAQCARSNELQQFPSVERGGASREQSPSETQSHTLQWSYVHEPNRLNSGRRGSSASLVSTNSSSATLPTQSECNSYSPRLRKRQRESDNATEHSSTKAPFFRLGLGSENGHELTGPNTLTLKRRFFTHSFPSRLHQRNSPKSQTSKEWSLVAGTSNTRDTARPRATDDLFEKDPLWPQRAGSDLMSRPSPHEQLDIPGNNILVPPKHAYSYIDPEDLGGVQEVIVPSFPSRRQPLGNAPDLTLHPCDNPVDTVARSPPPLMNLASQSTTNNLQSPVCQKGSAVMDPASANTLLATSTVLGSGHQVAPHSTSLTNHLPCPDEFSNAVAAYLAGLHPDRVPKALITRELYEEIASTLQRERNNLPGMGTPQFRFWCRKHFSLKTIPRLRFLEQSDFPHSVIALPTGHPDLDDHQPEPEVITHDDQPVVAKEQIYNVLAQCHLLANHAGRDKTTAIVRKNYSWVPKVLVGDFIKRCPVCHAKKVAGVV